VGEFKSLIGGGMVKGFIDVFIMIVIKDNVDMFCFIFF